MNDIWGIVLAAGSSSSVYVDAMDEPPQGGGEPAIISVGGPIANAVFDACDARVFRTPLTS